MADIEDWAGRYRQLLNLAGTDGNSIKAYRDSLNIPSEGGADSRTSLDDCLHRPEVLRSALHRSAGPGADFRELRIHASVLQQKLALYVIAPLTLGLFLDGESPLPDPEHIYLEPIGHTGGWSWGASGLPLGMDEFPRQVAVQVNAWYPFFREEFGVSPGAYWSSVGLGLCAPFSALYDKAPPDRLCAEATQWLNRFDCAARNFIDWIPVTRDRLPCAIPQRRGCCLKFQLPEGSYCGTCGVYRKQRLAAAEAID